MLRYLDYNDNFGVNGEYTYIVTFYYNYLLQKDLYVK